MLRIPLVSCTNHVEKFRVTFLCEFSTDEVQIQQTYGGIPNRLHAGVFKVTISLVWRSFQLEEDQVIGRQLSVACLVNFLHSLTGG